MKKLLLLILISLGVSLAGCGRVVRGDSEAKFGSAPLLARRGGSLEVVCGEAIPKNVRNVRSLAVLVALLKMSPKMAERLLPEGEAGFTGVVEISSPKERVRLIAENGNLRPVSQ